MLCHDWLSSRHVTIGTKNGKVLVLEEAELRTTVDVYGVVQMAVSEGSMQLHMSVRKMSLAHTACVQDFTGT